MSLNKIVSYVAVVASVVLPKLQKEVFTLRALWYAQAIEGGIPRGIDFLAWIRHDLPPGFGSFRVVLGDYATQVPLGQLYGPILGHRAIFYDGGRGSMSKGLLGSQSHGPFLKSNVSEF
jgi:hypothetical protein